MAEKALKQEAPGHSLQPTLLVNDAYLRLLDQRNVTPEDRSAVMAAGANIIRRLLVDYARKRKRLKRRGDKGRGNPLHLSIADSASQIDVLELNDAMDVFAKERPRAAQVVELKSFGGLTSEEITEQLGVSIRTVKNDWRFTKPDRKNFFGIARGSVRECVPLLELASRRGLVNGEVHQELKAQLEEIARMLSGLIKGLEKQKT